MRQRLAFRRHVDHLAAGHAARAGGVRQRQHQLAAGLRVGMGVGLGQDLEGAGLQGVAGQDGGGFVEGAVGAGLAAAQIVVVHGGQVVVHQAVGVQHFDAGGDAGGAGLGDAEQAATSTTRKPRRRLPPPRVA